MDVENNSRIEPVGQNKPNVIPSRHGTFRDPRRAAIAAAALSRNAEINASRAASNTTASSRKLKFADTKRVKDISRVGQSMLLKLIEEYIGDASIINKIRFIIAIFNRRLVSYSIFKNSVEYYLTGPTARDKVILEQNPAELQAVKTKYETMKWESENEKRVQRASEYKTRRNTLLAKRSGTNYNYETHNNGIVLNSDMLDEENLHEIIDFLKELKRIDDQNKARLQRRRNAYEENRTARHSTPTDKKAKPKPAKPAKDGGGKTRRLNRH